MNDIELNKLRAELLNNGKEKLKELFLTYRKDCINVLLAKRVANQESASDIFTDAIMIFNQNVLSGKIKTLTSIKSYLISTCMNIAKSSLTKTNTRNRKAEDVRLLFYEKNYNITEEEKQFKSELISVSQNALKQLSSDCQKLLTAFYVYRISMKELAEEFGLLNSDVAKTKKLRCYKAWIKKAKSLMK